jgi:hypothetical protein
MKMSPRQARYAVLHFICAPSSFVILMWSFVQALYDCSRAKSEFLCCEREAWERLTVEAQRAAMAEVQLAEARQREVGLGSELVNLRIRYQEAVADA